MGNICLASLEFELKNALEPYKTIHIATAEIISYMDCATLWFENNNSHVGTCYIGNRSNGSDKGLKIYLSTGKFGIEKGSWISAFLHYYTMI